MFHTLLNKVSALLSPSSEGGVWGGPIGVWGGHAVFLVLLLLAGCTRPAYVEQHDLPAAGWHQDSVLTYTVPVTDTVGYYDVQLMVRTDNNYPYQNLWLFVTEYRDSTLVTCDTIECMLADDRGQWLARGNTYHDLPLLYAPRQRFPRTGNYTYTIQQGMREETLRGVRSMGVVIIKNEK